MQPDGMQGRRFGAGHQIGPLGRLGLMLSHGRLDAPLASGRPDHFVLSGFRQTRL